MLESLFHITTESRELAVLIDPDRIVDESIPEALDKIHASSVSIILIGGSLVNGKPLDPFVDKVKSRTKLPVVIFPGSGLQLAQNADAILFLSLISGRNPEFLIGHHIVSAPYVKKMGLQSIATGYMLIDSGRETTASYVSNTKPIPSNKPQIAAATALAGEMLGFKILYMDAGSGAKDPIPANIISAVKDETTLPLIVGGGIRTRQNIESAYNAGANLVVVGTAFEQNNDFFSELK